MTFETEWQVEVSTEVVTGVEDSASVELSLTTGGLIMTAFFTPEEAEKLSLDLQQIAMQCRDRAQVQLRALES